MRKVRHDPVFIDRGHEHVHRWQINCSCGWIGVKRRRKRETRMIFVVHQRSNRRGRPAVLDLREVTPTADLPEILR